MNVESCSKLSSAVHVMGIVIKTPERWEEESSYLSSCLDAPRKQPPPPLTTGWTLLGGIYKSAFSEAY